MNCERFPFFKHLLGYNQIVFTTIKIIYNGTNKSAREFGCHVFVNNTFNLNVKIRANFLGSVEFTYDRIAFVSHCDSWCPMYRELLHFIVHLSCNFEVTSILRPVFYFGGTTSMHCKVHQIHFLFFWHRYHNSDTPPPRLFKGSESKFWLPPQEGGRPEKLKKGVKVWCRGRSS